MYELREHRRYGVLLLFRGVRVLRVLVLIPMDDLCFCAWNMRGYNHPLKRKELKKSIANWKVFYGAILETRVRDSNMASLH